MSNTLVTIADNKVGVSSSNANLADFYEARVLSATDYYAFGMAMKERSFQAESYRYGFNGQERDRDINEEGNHTTAEFWEYSAVIGRRWNIDPVVKVWESGYAVLGNMPIIMNDIKGNDWIIYYSSDTHVRDKHGDPYIDRSKFYRYKRGKGYVETKELLENSTPAEREYLKSVIGALDMINDPNNNLDVGATVGRISDDTGVEGFIAYDDPNSYQKWAKANTGERASMTRVAPNGTVFWNPKVAFMCPESRQEMILDKNGNPTDQYREIDFFNFHPPISGLFHEARHVYHRFYDPNHSSRNYGDEEILTMVFEDAFLLRLGQIQNCSYTPRGTSNCSEEYYTHGLRKKPDYLSIYPMNVVKSLMQSLIDSHYDEKLLKSMRNAYNRFVHKGY